MSYKTIATKILEDGPKLTLGRYELRPDIARVLKKPPGSEETVLILGNYPAETPLSTSPSASWYVKQVDMGALYNAINSRPDFELVQKLLDSVRSDKDASKVTDFLRQLTD